MLKFNLLHTFPAFTIKNYRTFFLSQLGCSHGALDAAYCTAVACL